MFSILWIAQSFACAGDIQINELFFHPPSHKNQEEWIELTNTGTEPMDLAGWRFTRGIDFEFPANTRLEPGGYLVIAADVSVFKSLHPDVPHVVGGWKGQLSNSGQTVQLEDASGHPVESIQYSDQGDWAVRVPGPSFRGHAGWEWSSAADGLGASLERIQPQLPGIHGQNWQTSLGTNGTPGAINSRFAINLPPIILDVAHSPPVPRSNEVVTVTTRFLDESTNVLAHLHWRIDGTNVFQSVAMSDAGPPADRTPGDGRYSAQIPAHAEGSIIEFYVSAEDSAGLRRTWPAPAQVAGVPAQILNALYQVDGSVPNTSKGVGNLPLYRIVLTAADRQELADINRNIGFAAQSHAQFNATFLAEDADGTTIRYTTGVRNRGNGSAARQPQSFRVNFRHDDRWKDVDGLNLNTQYTPAQLFGSALYRKAGLPAAVSRPVRVRVNASTLSDRGAPTYGFYIANELIDSDYAKKRFPSDSNGNVYRGIRASGRGADLHYEGELPGPYRVNYSKRTSVSQDDWSDLIGLCRVIGDTNAVSATWIDQIRASMDIEQWMLYFALETIVDNHETNLGNGNNGTGQGDDYFLYFGTLDRRALVIPYDLDTILGVGDSPFNPEDGLFRMNSNPWIARILRQPPFAAVYYRTLQRLLDGPCSAVQFDTLVDEVLGGLGVETQMTTMKQFAAARRTALDRLIPRSLSVTNTDWPSMDGTLQINALTVQLGGRANAATTFSVKLNDIHASYSHMDATWIVPQVSLNPGLNVLVLTAHDSIGREIERISARVFRPLESFQSPPFTIASTPFSVQNWNQAQAIWDQLELGDGSPAIRRSFKGHDAGAAIPPGVSIPSTPPAESRLGIQIHEVQVGRSREGQPALDAIELFNPTESTVLLTGFSLSQSPTTPRHYIFPERSALPPHGYLIVRAAKNSANPDPFQTGFGLDASGDSIYLFDAQTNQLDRVVFGLQIPGYTIGRVPAARNTPSSDGPNPGWVWTLCEPTLGAENRPVPLGDPTEVRISEWLASPGLLFGSDFVELHNPTPMPIALGGLFMTDHPTALRPNVGPIPAAALSEFVPIGTRLAPLSFLAPRGWQQFRSEGNSEGKADQIGFKLASDTGTLALYETTDARASANQPWSIVQLVDFITYRAQYPGVSQGRSSGFAGLRYFLNPTPGIANPVTSIPGTNELQSLVLNEVLAHNRSLRDADGQFPDWVEIYNPNPIPISLAGIQLTDDFQIPDRFVFPAASEIAGFGQVLVRCLAASQVDESDGLVGPPPTPFRATFGLSRNGGSLFLLASKSAGETILDQLYYGILPADLSLARFPNAAGPWVLSQPTPLLSNQPAELGNPNALRINEWMANPTSGDDWFELYNSDPLPIDLSGFTLSDDPSNPSKHSIAPHSYIAGHGFIQFHADDQPDQGPHHVRFQLSNKGEFIGLYGTNGTVMDSVTFGSQAEGISEGRLPDGAGEFVRFASGSTPGGSNWKDSDSDGLPDPWESAHGFSSENNADALLDTDGDGMINRDEFRASTDPRDTSDVLRLDLAKSNGGSLHLEFRVQPGHSYRVQVRDSLDTPWRDFEAVVARDVPRRIRIPIAGTAPLQYLRLVVLEP